MSTKLQNCSDLSRFLIELNADVYTDETTTEQIYNYLCSLIPLPPCTCGVLEGDFCEKVLDYSSVISVGQIFVFLVVFYS